MNEYQAGKLDREGLIEKQSTTRNAFNEVIGGWVKVCCVPCGKLEKAAAEKETESGRLTEFGDVEFLIRYRCDLKPTMRISVEGVVYQITGIKEGPGRRRWLVLNARRND